MNSCVRGNWCNCDAHSREWKEEDLPVSGYLRYKEDLPVSEVRFGEW